MDTTPLWLIAVFAVIVILFLIYMELRHQRKNPGESHYVTNNFSTRDREHLGIADRANKARQETK